MAERITNTMDVQEVTTKVTPPDEDSRLLPLEREAVIADLERRSPVPLPSSAKELTTDNGAGRLLFNYGNANHLGFDPDNPTHRLCHALILHNGTASLMTLSQELGMLPTDVESLANRKNMLQVVKDRKTEAGVITETVVESPPLEEYLAELTERKVNYRHLVMSPEERAAANNSQPQVPPVDNLHYFPSPEDKRVAR